MAEATQTMSDDLAAQTQEQTKAQLPKPEYDFMAESKELPSAPTSKLGQAYAHAKDFFSDLETHASEKVLKPFRAGLDAMAADLENAAETGHTQSGGELNSATRALAGGVGKALEFVPVGKDVKETALMAAAPSLPEGHLFEGLRVIPSEPMAAEEAAMLRKSTGKALESEDELNIARKGQAEHDANVALTKGKVDTDPKATVPSKNKNVTERRQIEKSANADSSPSERGKEPTQPMADAEKADLQKWHGQPLKSEEDYILARKQKAEWDSNQALAKGKVDTDPKAAVPSKNKASSNLTRQVKSNHNSGEMAHIDTIVPAGEDQDPRAVSALADKIKKSGRIDPIEVSKYEGDPKLYIEDGHHRFAAAKKLGITDVPIEIVNKKSATKNPKSVIEGAGLKYKGEVTPGSGVHMMEHPDHPGKTAAIKEADITPDAVGKKMQSKLKEFDVRPAAAEALGSGKN